MNSVSVQSEERRSLWGCIVMSAFKVMRSAATSGPPGGPETLAREIQIIAAYNKLQ